MEELIKQLTLEGLPGFLLFPLLPWVARLSPRYADSLDVSPLLPHPHPLSSLLQPPVSDADLDSPHMSLGWKVRRRCEKCYQ